MDPDRQLEELLRQTRFATTPEEDRRILADAFQALSQAARSNAADRRKLSRARWRPMTATAAAIVAVAATIYLFFGAPGPPTTAHAFNVDVEVQRRGVQLTVFNPTDSREPTLFLPLVAPAQVDSFGQQKELTQQLGVQSRRAAPGQPGGQSQGMALVRDQRLVLHLKAGDNLVKFSDVASAIDPTSVTLVSETDPVGTKVIEQNFEFDLASGDALLKRYVDRKITCIGRDGDKGDGFYEGFLVSYDPQTIVLAESAPEADPKKARPKTEAISRGTLKAIRCDSMPKDLYTRPTLVWKLRTNKPGDHLTTLSYICGNISWQADYVAVITESDVNKGDRLDLKGWVSMDNRSGATYDKAGLKLIAGDVNRVRDPWAPVRPTFDERFYTNAPVAGDALPARAKVFIAKDFFEYKLYTLSEPSTIKDEQIKQLSLLQAQNIVARRRFLYDPRMHATQVAVELVVQNKKENGLGRALPKGRVTLVAEDAEGESQLLGRDQIDHTPKDEELKLKMGQAFDVAGEFKDVEVLRPAHNELIQTSEVRVRNHKDTDIDVRVVGHLQGYANWKITKTTDEFSKHDFQTVYFDFRLKANSEKAIRYTVDYRW